MPGKPGDMNCGIFRKTLSEGAADCLRQDSGTGSKSLRNKLWHPARIPVSQASAAKTRCRDEEILLGAPLDPVECGKSNKPAAIAREIGKRPVLAFGNSTGDYSMLNYAEGNPDHTGMGFFVVCDDTDREYGNDEKAADYYKEVEEQGWTPFSMADDWKTIYGSDVQKTGLPGAETELTDPEDIGAEEASPDSEGSEGSEAAPVEEEDLPGTEDVQPGTEEVQPDSEEALPDAA